MTSLQILDPKTLDTIEQLKQDPALGYRTLLVKNPFEGTVANVIVEMADTEMGNADASYLENRSVIDMSYSRAGVPTTSFLGVSPFAVIPAVTADWRGVLLDGWLQLSADSFSWYGRLDLGSIDAGKTTQFYLRFQRPTYAVTIDMSFTLTNLSAVTMSSIVLTAEGDDLLSLDDLTYEASISVGTLVAGASKTIYLRSAVIDPSKLGPAEISVSSSGGATPSSVLIDTISLFDYYTSIDEVKDWINAHVADVTLITYDEELRSLIREASRKLDRETRRHFDMQTTTERYDGTGQAKLVLENYPVLAILEVQIYNFNNQLIRDIKSTDTDFSSELIIDYVNGFVTLSPASMPLSPYPFGSMWYWPWSTFSPALLAATDFDYSNHFGKGTSNIAITYTHGYEAPPDPIRRAAVKMVVIELLRKRGAADSQGVATRSIAGATVTYATRGGASGGSGPYGHLIDELDQDVRDVIKQYTAKRLRVI